MQYEIIPCADGDAEFIEEQADQATNAIVPPEEGAQEEVFVYQVTDPEGRFLGGCILITEEWKTAIIVDLWVEEAYRHQGIASALIRESERRSSPSRSRLLQDYPCGGRDRRRTLRQAESA